jgi:hypothetical protein
VVWSVVPLVVVVEVVVQVDVDVEFEVDVEVSVVVAELELIVFPTLVVPCSDVDASVMAEVAVVDAVVVAAPWSSPQPTNVT